MSEEDRRSRLRRAADWGMRLGIPLAVFAVVIAVFMGEEMSIDHEVQIVAPAEGSAGEAVPVRVLLFDALEEPDGPRLVPARARIRLVSSDGTVIAQAELPAAAAGGAEGAIRVPSDAPSPLTLEAIGLVDGAAVASARARLDLTDAPSEEESTGRPTGPLQQLAPGPIEGRIPPDVLDLRVVSGVCVPDQACEILVHVGEPAAIVTLEGTTLETRSGPEAPTSGLARLVVAVHGPEARGTLTARRDGEPVATRSVQLPVALATPALRIARRLLDARTPPSLEVGVLGDRPGVIVDAYRGGRWVATGSVATTDRAFDAPFGPLPPGLVRLQVRADPFSSERAAVAWIMVGRPGQGPDAILGAGLEAIGESGGDSSAPDGDPELRFAWASASAEWSVRGLPAGVSGFAVDTERVATRRAQLRVAALLGLALGLVVLVVVFLRRGIDAALQAQRVMDETGDPELASARHRRRTLLSALVIVATVLLAFLGAAALIVARAHLLQ